MLILKMSPENIQTALRWYQVFGRLNHQGRVTLPSGLMIIGLSSESQGSTRL